LGNRGKRRPGALGVERDPPAEEIVGVDTLRDHVRVGQGRLRAALSVAGWAGLGTRAPRTDSERTGRVDPRDRAAARADLDDVDDGHFDRVACEGGRAPGVVVARPADGAALDARG